MYMAQLIEFTMHHGRIVLITMSSATSWTGSMITLLFVSLTANCFKIKLLLLQLKRSCPWNSWMFSGQSSSLYQRNAVVSYLGGIWLLMLTHQSKQTADRQKLLHSYLNLHYSGGNFSNSPLTYYVHCYVYCSVSVIKMET